VQRSRFANRRPIPPPPPPPQQLRDEDDGRETIEAAPTADAVWSAVEQAGPDLDGPPITHQG
jgi:hypothetical protein